METNWTNFSRPFPIAEAGPEAGAEDGAKAEAEGESSALFAQRKKDGQTGEAIGEGPDGSKLG